MKSLKEFRIESGMSKRRFAIFLGIPYTTYAYASEALAKHIPSVTLPGIIHVILTPCEEYGISCSVSISGVFSSVGIVKAGGICSETCLAVRTGMTVADRNLCGSQHCHAFKFIVICKTGQPRV